MKKKIPLLILSLLLLSALVYAVVPRDGSDTDSLSLYYPVAQNNLPLGGDAISSVRVDWQEMRSAAVEQQVQKVLELLMGGCQDKEFRSPIPSDTRLQSCTVSGSTALVDFSTAYGQMSGIDLTMADYCVALSLTQIAGIYTVRITVNGEDLAYRPRNDFRAEDVLLTSQEDVVRNVSVYLYFPAGQLLTSEQRILTIYEGQSQTDAVIAALMAGSQKEDVRPLLPEGFQVLNTRVEDNVCYVNLASENETILPDSLQQQRMILQGIVRSMCSIRAVYEVQFLVDGQWRPSFGQLDISQPMDEYD